MYFYDPAGNIVELIGRARLFSGIKQEAFDGNKIQNISEIGMAWENLESAGRRFVYHGKTRAELVPH